MSDLEDGGALAYIVNKIMIPAVRKALGTKFKRGVAAGLFVAFLWILKRKLEIKPVLSDERINFANKGVSKERLTFVDTKFVNRLIHLLRITMGTREAVLLSLLTGVLIGRTMLSISLTSLNSRIVKSMMQGKFTQFVKRILLLAFCALPGSLINSSLEFLTNKLALSFNERLSTILNTKLLGTMNYYKITNLDHRIPNPEQRLTQDVERWSQSIALLFINLTKPIIDIVLFSKKLSELVGIEGPLLMIAWYVFSGIVIKYISPPFGKLTETSQILQGEYRKSHSDLITEMNLFIPQGNKAGVHTQGGKINLEQFLRYIFQQNIIGILLNIESNLLVGYLFYTLRFLNKC